MFKKSRGYSYKYKKWPKLPGTEDRIPTNLYKKARKACYERDKNSCRFPYCTETQGLVPHHIMKYADYPLIRDSVNNLITLCNKHHRLVTGKEEDYASLFFQLIRTPPDVK